ncbi:MAG: alpha/beta fold hydrolase, partial [Rhodospirillaceae bacterium]|nr:alpha/beta fold hydrolase [Rhodospirillaceae bacterium]
NRPGWWNAAIGPGKALDTDQFFIVSSNVLGSYGGSTGPASTDPDTGARYAMTFPVVTVADMVRAQRRLAEALNLPRFHAVLGGCMGGFQVLEWLRQAPRQAGNAVIISATARTSTHNTALWSVLRRAIMSDPAWNGGNYYDGPRPDAGMGLMAAYGALFWMSRETLEQRFGLRRTTPEPAWSFAPEFEVEQFLERIANNAGRGLDPNALLYLTRAIDYFDLTVAEDGLAGALRGARNQVTLVSYSNDWRYPASEMEEIHRTLIGIGADSRHVTLENSFGHGGFLMAPDQIAPIVREALGSDT